MRHIGVDLHKTNFVVCFLDADDTQRLETYTLTRDGLTRFVGELEAADELAVEATHNVHYFYDQVKGHVSRVAVVDTYRFGVVAKSKKKTDKADAAALARFLKLGWLPEVQMPSEQVRTLRQLLQARETLVSMRTKLKNMAHAAFSATESEWVAQHLESLGHEVIVADPNFAPMYSTLNKKIKTDKRDARVLCDARRDNPRPISLIMAFCCYTSLGWSAVISE